MENALEELSKQLGTATLPEDVFGQLHGDTTCQLKELSEQYRRLARIAHPDGYSVPAEKAAAHDAFTRLTLLYQHARERILAGSYRNPQSIPADAVYTILSRKHEYHLTGVYESGMYSLNYAGGYILSGKYHPISLHLATQPDCNPFIRNEAAIFERLRQSENYRKFSAYLPRLEEMFTVQVGTSEHAGTAYHTENGWYNLKQVRDCHPLGVDPRDMAWMFRRLLVALGFLHSSGVTHCALLPGNILIQPDDHGLMLTNFGSAFSMDGTGRNLPIVCSNEEKSWYPPDLLPTRKVNSATDIYLAAQCMRYILGADLNGRGYPVDTPRQIKLFLRGCIMPTTRSTPSDAWALKEEFDTLLHQIWGKRKFHPFSMVCNQQTAQYQGGKNG
jgi:hypothetical protein